MSSLSLLFFDIGARRKKNQKLCWVYKALNSGKLCSFMIQVLLPTIQYLFMWKKYRKLYEKRTINDKNENDKDLRKIVLRATYLIHFFPLYISSMVDIDRYPTNYNNNIIRNKNNYLSYTCVYLCSI